MLKEFANTLGLLFCIFAFVPMMTFDTAGSSLVSAEDGVIHLNSTTLISHVGLSCGVRGSLLSFDTDRFESVVATSVNCTTSQIAAAGYYPTLIDDLMLVEIVFFSWRQMTATEIEETRILSTTQVLTTGTSSVAGGDHSANDFTLKNVTTRNYENVFGPNQVDAEILRNRLMEGFTELLPLAKEYTITSAVPDESLAIPPRIYSNETAAEGVELLPREGIYGFIGMVTVMSFMVLCSLMIVVCYLRRGRHHKAFLSSFGAISAPATYCSAWVLGGCDNVKQLACQAKLDLSHVSAVACGGSGHVLIVAQGSLFVGGTNHHGQLGLGHCVDAPVLVVNDFFEEYVIVKCLCGEDFSAVVTNEGELYTFGSGAEGALGHGDANDRAVPTFVEALAENKVIGAAAGPHHMVILCDDGLYAFGWNDHGQLMTGDQKSTCIPVLVKFFEGYEDSIREIACGVESTIILCGDWEVYACGGNSCGQLGIGHYDDISEPELIPLPQTTTYVYSVSTWYHTLIPCDDGLYVCGEGDGFRLGTGDEVTQCDICWVDSVADYDVRFAVAGNEHSFFVTSSCEILTVGRSTNGKLGAGEYIFRVPSLLNLHEVLDTSSCVTASSGLPLLKMVTAGPTYTIVKVQTKPDSATHIAADLLDPFAPYAAGFSEEVAKPYLMPSNFGASARGKPLYPGVSQQTPTKKRVLGIAPSQKDLCSDEEEEEEKEEEGNDGNDEGVPHHHETFDHRGSEGSHDGTGGSPPTAPYGHGHDGKGSRSLKRFK